MIIAIFIKVFFVLSCPPTASPPCEKHNPFLSESFTHIFYTEHSLFLQLFLAQLFLFSLFLPFGSLLPPPVCQDRLGTVGNQFALTMTLAWAISLPLSQARGRFGAPHPLYHSSHDTPRYTMTSHVFYCAKNKLDKISLLEPSESQSFCQARGQASQAARHGAGLAHHIT